jgi:hypothetical protein
MTRIPIILLAASGLVFAQDQTTGGWRRADAPPPAQPSASAPVATPGQDPEPVDRSDAYGQPAPNGQTAPDGQQAPGAQAQPSGQPAPNGQMSPYGQPAPYPAGSLPPQTTTQQARPSYGLPAEVTVRPGTYITARLGQPLSSDHNQIGDTFVAHLAQPLVVDGVVVAQRGQTVYGRVAEVQKQKADHPSRLGLELTSVTLADGTQVPIQSQLVTRTGGRTPAGVQAGTVAGTTGVGAIVGGAVGWGTGAAIGAGVGAVAGVAGVLLTRNHPTVLYPETALTFDVQAPVTISTVNAPGAFRFVGPEDYTQQPYNAGLQRRPVGAPGASGAYYSPYAAPYAAPYGGYAYPYGYPYPYAYAPYPYYGYGWGPGFGVVIGGRGWYGRRW